MVNEIVLNQKAWRAKQWFLEHKNGKSGTDDILCFGLVKSINLKK